ncbi:MAG: ATP synthase F1 subunit gamma [Puniceicoccales bacterium]|jgi:F-type H+-transporting ATPase subunit gamma|nr:ATP synthase F1 subunit gamma [Puniceicoccales bacterium]
MGGIREIRTRIKAVRSTAQITRAMQLVASSKMKKAQDNATSHRPYTLRLMEMGDALRQFLEEKKIRHPFYHPRPVKTRGILWITTERGLCGSLNQNLIKSMEPDSIKTELIVVGQKGMSFTNRIPYPILGRFPFPDTLPSSYVDELVEFLVHRFEEGEMDVVDVLFSQFKNTLVQTPSWRTLLPLQDLSREREDFYTQFYLPRPPEDPRPLLLESDLYSLVKALSRLLLREKLHHLLLEAKASEHSARMVAMKSATDNAENLMEELQLAFNKLRQAGITQEILELTAGQQEQMSS